MTVEGCDYSFSRPDPACLYQTGIRFAIRYASDTGKGLTAAETTRLHAAGLAIVTCYQEGHAFMLQGQAHGEAGARIALTLATKAGMPANRPVYFALDIDPRPLTAAEWAQIRGYLTGAASVLGRSNIGVYGGRTAIDTLCPDSAPWGWQTFAWSGGIWSPKAKIRQYQNGLSSCGGLIDRNRATVADYGQWEQEKNMPLTQLEINAIAAKAAVAVVNQKIIFGAGSSMSVAQLLLGRSPELLAQFAAIKAAIDADPNIPVSQEMLDEAVAKALEGAQLTVDVKEAMP